MFQSQRFLFGLVLAVVVVALSACPPQSPVEDTEPIEFIPSVPSGPVVVQPSEPQKFSFDDFEWLIKESAVPIGPGNNRFSPKNVSLANRIIDLSVKQQAGYWQCAEVILAKSLGYGTYVVQSRGQIEKLDSNLVWAVFLWDDNDASPNHREIDFLEVSRFGNAADANQCQYVIQPCEVCTTDLANCQRFAINSTASPVNLTTYLVWSPGRVEMRTYLGSFADTNPPVKSLIKKWVYEGSDVPVPGDERVHFNIWIQQGEGPESGYSQSVQMTRFRFLTEVPDWQDVINLTTNLPDYTLAMNLEKATKAIVNGDDATVDSYGGLYSQVALHPGDNQFAIQGLDDSGRDAGGEYLVNINYDSSLSTAGQSLLYYVEPAKGTMIVNLDADCVWGFLPTKIAAVTHDGQHAVDFSGNVYSTVDHQLEGLPLPFAGSNVLVPMFSPDDQYCYCGRMKFDFAKRALVADNYPIAVNAECTALIDGHQFIQTVANDLIRVELATDQATQTSLGHGCQYFEPQGNYGFATSYSWASGSLTEVNLYSQAVVFGNSSLSDYIHEVVFTSDGQTAFIGAGGNPYYGEGGVIVFDLTTKSILSQYDQYGSGHLVVGDDDLVYARSAFCINGGRTQSTKDHRGIDVLSFDKSNGKLTYIKTYYLGNSDSPIGGRIILKTGK